MCSFFVPVCNTINQWKVSSILFPCIQSQVKKTTNKLYVSCLCDCTDDRQMELESVIRTVCNGESRPDVIYYSYHIKDRKLLMRNTFKFFLLPCFYFGLFLHSVFQSIAAVSPTFTQKHSFLFVELLCMSNIWLHGANVVQTNWDVFKDWSFWFRKDALGDLQYIHSHIGLWCSRSEVSSSAGPEQQDLQTVVVVGSP